MASQNLESGQGRANNTAPAKAETSSCPHATLVPHWDAVQDMGDREKIHHYICDVCQETFSPEEGGSLRLAARERLAAIGPRASNSDQWAPQQQQAPRWKQLLWKVWQRSSVAPLPAKLRSRLVKEFGLSEHAVTALRMLEESGRSSGRKVTYFRVFDPVAIEAVGLAPRHFSDLPPQLILYAGQIESDGEIVLRSNPSEG